MVPDPATTFPAALLDPQIYPHPVSAPRLAETHISWVILTGEFAYKVKKPLKLEFLDFSTLALRKFYCEEELRLNARFAPNLYLGVSRIVHTAAGLRLDVEGEAVDYAVRMRQFAREHELVSLLERGAVEVAALARLGHLLANAQASAPVASQVESDKRIARLLEGARRNIVSLRELAGSELESRVEAWVNWTGQACEWMMPLLRARLTNGKVRECHGDLHCGNIVELAGELTPFDALEFDPDLRWLDVAADIAFLYMDLETRERPDLAAALLDAWLAATGDFAALRTLRFYAAYRAAIRAKVSALRRRQQSGSGAEPRYLAAIEGYAAKPAPLLIAMNGVSGSGKSWLAERLLGPLHAVRIRSDLERKRLAGLAATAASDGKIYSQTATARTYARLQECAREALAGGFTTIIDAANLQRQQRAEFRALAVTMGIPFRIIATPVTPEVARQRIAVRAARGNDPSEATPEVLAHQLAHAEPLNAAEQAYSLAVDAAGAAVLAQTLHWLRASRCDAQQ